ncbi:MAG: HlyD family efflux transporter periplasmic adaptor subunit [Acidobacteria bacterium]|nr:HlyD family efflux transporter periplasmic adaptor subunit [Acidobacteriota bacterium]MBI3281575.1 HlyD family efflux transporter periplasmic adaptor subunit [Acidobacteriota bacterium]
MRLTGTVEAANVATIRVPHIVGQNPRVVLIKLVANGSRVSEGDLIAEFDRTQQLENARDAEAKFDDLTHQVDQRLAQNRSESEKRSADLQKAQADLAKAEIQLSKGPLLSEIDRLKNETRAAAARARVASLMKSSRQRDIAEAAAVRILELQRDRHNVALERATRNAERLQVKAPLAGMIALENVWRNGSMGPAQEGDQLWGGQPLVRIFDPSQMNIHVYVGEPDGALLVPGTEALVKLDAYPDRVFHATFLSASPVAATALGSPIKSFAAKFRLLEIDPQLLPDLSAALVIQRPPANRPADRENSSRNLAPQSPRRGGTAGF